jgi:uncharacterized protein YfdQ (DUF2303 family)
MDIEGENESEARAIVTAMEKYGAPEIVRVRRGSAEEAEVLIIPSGKSPVDVKAIVDKYLPHPERKTGTATLTTLKSFVDHVNRFKDAQSAIFADVENRADPKLMAVIDYHQAGTGHARWGQHRALYKFPVSDEWKAWTGRKDPMDQTTFAEFIEERIGDVVDPALAGQVAKGVAEQLGITLASPARLMEMARGLSIRVGQRVTQHVNTSTGEAVIGFEEKHEGEGGGPLKVPGGFLIAIPVFKNGPLYQVPARLRYRVQGGSVVWWFALQRTDEVWDHAINEACAQAEEGTTLPVFFGKPEQQ